MLFEYLVLGNNSFSTPHAWDGKGAAQVGEGEEGGPVGGAEPGDPSLAGEAVLPMKLRVEVGDLFIGLCAALLIVFGACLWPPKVVPKEADIGGSCWYCWRRHIHIFRWWQPLFTPSLWEEHNVLSRTKQADVPVSTWVLGRTHCDVQEAWGEGNKIRVSCSGQPWRQNTPPPSRSKLDWQVQ